MPRPQKDAKTYSLTPTKPDPLASLRPRSLLVDWDGVTWTVPAVPALSWLEILLAEEIDFEAIFPGLCGEDAVLDVNWRILSGTLDDLEPVIRDCIEVASGRRWWITLRLMSVLRENWEAVAPAVAGVPSDRVSLATWLDVAYGVLVERLSHDPKYLSEFTSRLVQPPREAAEPINDEVEGNAFLAAMRMASR